MQFTNILLALMATTAAVAAPAAGENTLARRVDCPNGWSVCGVSPHLNTHLKYC